MMIDSEDLLFKFHLLLLIKDIR